MEATEPKFQNFSISEGGSVNRLLLKMNLYHNQKKLTLVALVITWLPLVIITLFEGTCYSGVQMPFIKDIAMQARLLFGLSILILIKTTIDIKVTEVLKYLIDSFMSTPEHDAIIQKAFSRSKKLTGSYLTELSLLIIVVVATFSFVQGGVYLALDSETTSWMTGLDPAKQDLSFAGNWAVCISIPIFQFLLLRWIWRYFVWTLLLFRISRTGLNLLATHADRAGGLGVIFQAQKNFTLIFVAGSAILSGQFTAQLIMDPDSFFSIRSMAIGYIVVSLILILFPLIFFSSQLIKTKQQALLRLSEKASLLSRKFENEWVMDKKTISDSEDAVDPSIICDYTGVYDSLRELKPVPFNLRDIIGIAVILFIPFIPILFVRFSVGELMQKIAGLLL